MHNTNHKFLKAFVIGSSFPVMIWPFLYLGIPMLIDPTRDFRFPLVAMTLPFVFGFINIIQLSLKNHYNPTKTGQWYIGVGVIYGILLALTGIYVGEVPMDLYSIGDNYYKFLGIPLAMLSYGLIWRFIVKNLNEIFNIDSP